jgi:hypothetical protein
MEPTQSWPLIRDLAHGMLPEYPTKQTKFSNVTSVTLFISRNFGGECTKISYVGFKGEYTTLKRDPIITICEIAANPTDHKVDGERKRLRRFIQ